ncbi:MAG: MlaD family protein [Planctomycetes bacterium]|nr:MlaD family protein [Planctomycetota bacterium]
MKRELFVGALFAALLALLLATTLYVNDPGFFKKRDGTFALTARFHDVSGLAVGADVWVYGTPGGRVKVIRPDEKGEVEVDLLLDRDPNMRENATVMIKPRSALGGSVVAIHPGTTDKPAWKGGIFDGQSVTDPFQEIANLAAELKGPLRKTIENAERISSDLAGKSQSITDNLDAFAKNAKQVSEDLAAGRGSLGKLLKDDTLHRDLEEAVASLKKIGDEARSGGGTLDILLHDQKLATDLKESVSSIKSVASKLDSGDGTLGRLLNDRKPFDDLASATADMRQLATDARSGKGALGKLIYDEQFGRRLDSITDDVAQITGKIRRGEGTLGKLVNDDSVYTDLKSALRSLRAGTDDVRENAPILTFAGFLFSGF